MSQRITSQLIARIGSVVLTVVAALAAAGGGWYLWNQRPSATVAAEKAEHTEDEHDHDHDHDSSAGEIELSPQARDNLGLRTQVVEVSTYTQYVSIPAAIVDWPGRTHIEVAAPLTGVVNAIFVSRGELVRSGQPMFTLRLTHQDLVKTQADFLSALGRLDVEQREIERLRSVTQSGAVAGKAMIEHEYEHDRLLAELQAERQAMLLHGLNEQQIQGIEQDRRLVREVTIYAPTLHGDRSLHHESEHQLHSPESSDSPSPPPGEVPSVTTAQPASFALQPNEPHEHLEAEFLVTELNVNRGQSIEAGQLLGQISDFSSVLIEGHAFQKDVTTLRNAASFKLPIQAVFESLGNPSQAVDDLRIAYIGNQIGLETRTLPVYVALENEVERSQQFGNQRYVSWRYKPGQRLHLRVPVQAFDNSIVVPLDAVAREGIERYVFVDHGDHFDRRPVRVVAQDGLSVALRNDGSLKPGQTIAVSGAHQLQMEMKNKSSGPIDPHAGHSH